MSYLRVVESRITDAMAAGAFDGLAGAGKPLDLRHGELAGDIWLGHHILENERLLPPWLQLAADIEAALARLATIDGRHAVAVDEARASGDWERRLPVIAAIRGEYEALARSTRARQDQFNYEAPGRMSERPGIWVDFHLERLDARIPPEVRHAHNLPGS